MVIPGSGCRSAVGYTKYLAGLSVLMTPRHRPSPVDPALLGAAGAMIVL